MTSTSAHPAGAWRCGRSGTRCSSRAASSSPHGSGAACSSSPRGALGLVSAHGSFGTEGAYVTVAGRSGVRAARVPLHETFRVFVDDEGILRTDHVLRLRRTVAVRLHNRMERVG